MNCKDVYLIIIVASIVIASVWYFPTHTWMSGSMDGASGGGFGTGGKGVRFSSTTWSSLDGATVDEIVVAYLSSEEARKDFELELKSDGKLVERELERLVKVFGDPQAKTGAARIISLRGSEIRSINTASLQPALTFERSWLKL